MTPKLLSPLKDRSTLMEPLAFEVPRLGQIARRVFSLAPDDLDSCLAEQRRHGGRIGEILCRNGLLTPRQVSECLRYQATWVAETRAAEIAPSAFPLDISLSICMPCFNEGAVLADVLDASLAILPAFVREFEMVVVDDGSSDNTADIAQRHTEYGNRVKLVQHERNLGYGAAVTTGFRAAAGDYVCLTDGDGQFSLIDLPQLLCKMAGADVVFGYRFRRADVVMRTVNARAWGWVVRMMLGVSVRDLDCAYKLFPRWVVDQLQMTSQGACISAEMVSQCVHSGLRIAEVPIRHYPRYHDGATGARFAVIRRAFRELPQLWRYRSAPTINRNGSRGDLGNGRTHVSISSPSRSEALRESSI